MFFIFNENTNVDNVCRLCRRGSRSMAQQYGGEHTLLYKKSTIMTSHSFNDFVVPLDPRMCDFVCVEYTVCWPEKLEDDVVPIHYA